MNNEVVITGAGRRVINMNDERTIRVFKYDNEALAWAEEVHRLTETEAERGRPRRD